MWIKNSKLEHVRNMQKTVWLSFFLVLVASSLHAGEIDPTQPEKFGEYTLWKSGVPNPNKKPLFWLDDDTVLFAGVLGETVRKETYRGGRGRLFIWKLGMNPGPYATDRWQNENRARGYCASQGMIRYHDSNLKKSHYWYGPLGKEVKQPLSFFKSYRNDTSSARSRSNASNQDACFGFGDDKMDGNEWYAGPERRFYIDFGLKPPTDNLSKPLGPIRLIDTKNDRAVDLDIPLADVRIRSSWHFRGTNRFLIWSDEIGSVGSLQKWHGRGCWPFWMISPSPTVVEKYCLPFSNKMGGSTFILDTKAGVFFYNHRYAALYRLDGHNKATRILDGVVNGAKVSPSGCKVAFNYLRSFKSEANRTSYLRTPQVLELCK